ncbi:MAG: FAD-dependent oxidoreductase [Alphaproteobacteria bacterium]
MNDKKADIIIYGAGIAGLWTLNRLKKLGYDVLLIESQAIGGIQTIASQGIIHSGLKYVLGGKINPLARAISAMPDIWREALKGNGSIDLSQAKIAAESQHLLIPKGMIGEIVKIGAKNFFGREVARENWPNTLRDSGFNGSIVDMGEPVLDIPSAIRALTEPHKNSIRASGKGITAKKYIYTAANGNDVSGVETQRRPLLMGLLKNAPFPLWAHLVGASEKPIATITTHKTSEGILTWYLGGQVAERAKESNPEEVYKAIRNALTKYLPALDQNNFEWAVLPIDRVEAKPGKGFMPDTPIIHNNGDTLYAWPTKLTFAPMMADTIIEELTKDNIFPSHTQSDWSFLPEVPYATPPWDTAQWKKEN